LQHSVDFCSELEVLQLQHPLDSLSDLQQSPHSQEQKGQQDTQSKKGIENQQQGRRRQALLQQQLFSAGKPCIFTIPAILFSAIIFTGIKISSLGQQQNFSVLSISVNRFPVFNVISSGFDLIKLVNLACNFRLSLKVQLKSGLIEALLWNKYFIPFGVFKNVLNIIEWPKQQLT